MNRSHSLYGFEPNKGAPIAFCMLFAISTIFHIYQNVKFKSWKVTGPLPWGGLLLVAGFAVREASAFDYDNLGLLIASVVLLQFAPPIYSLSNYIVLGRTFYYVPHLSPIHPGRVLTTFIGLDLIIGIITGNGAAKASDTSNSDRSIKIGLALIRTSIILQLVCFILFITLEIIFHRRCIRTKIIQKHKKLRTIIYLLYASSGCILLRNAYRVVEVWQGHDGYLAKHEVFFYIFDGMLMLINSVMLNFCHPMEYLPPSWKIYLAEDGVTEMEGDSCVDKRPCWVTVLDPLDLVGIVKKFLRGGGRTRSEKERFR